MTAADAAVVQPWRLAAPGEMAGLYQREHERFARLGWDTTAQWPLLERGRLSGAITGLVLRDARGVIAGWTYGVVAGDELQIGAVAAPSRETTAALLDAVVACGTDLGARALRVFAFSDAPTLAEALRARGCGTGAYHYLVAPLEAGDSGDPVLAPWRARDLAAAAGLLAEAYPEDDPLRPFGRAGRLDTWVTYVAGLTTTTGCGVFAPDLSVISRDTAGTLTGLALVTRLGAGTAHLAQLAVAPASRGGGLGARLLRGAMQRAVGSGLSTMSLLVGETNGRARRLYDACGFRPMAAFLTAHGSLAPVATAATPDLAAGWPQPCRSTSAACVSGGVSTRR